MKNWYQYQIFDKKCEYKVHTCYMQLMSIYIRSVSQQNKTWYVSSIISGAVLSRLTIRECPLASSEYSGQLPAVITHGLTKTLCRLCTRELARSNPELTNTDICIFTCSKSAEVNLFQCMCESSMGQDKAAQVIDSN